MERLYRISLTYFLVICTIPSAFLAPVDSPENRGGFTENVLSQSQNCRYPIEGILKDPAFVSHANKTCYFTEPVPTICSLLAGAIKNICASEITKVPTKEELSGLLTDENLGNEDGAQFCQRLNASVPFNYEDRSMVDSFTRLDENKKSECTKVCTLGSTDGSVESGDINSKVKINPVCLLGAKVFQDLSVIAKHDGPATTGDADTIEELPVSPPGAAASSPAAESRNNAGVTAPEAQNDYATGSEKMQSVAPASSTSKILPGQVSPNASRAQSGSTEIEDVGAAEVSPKLPAPNSNAEPGSEPELPTLSQGSAIPPASEVTVEDPADSTKETADKRNGGAGSIQTNALTQGPEINDTAPKPANNATIERKPEEPASSSGVAAENNKNGDGTAKVNVTVPASASSEQGSPVDLTSQGAAINGPPPAASSTKGETANAENDNGDDNVGQISRNDQDAIISPKPQQGSDGGEVDDDDNKVNPEITEELKKPSSSSSKTDTLDQDYEDGGSNGLDGIGGSSPAQIRPQIQTEGRRPQNPSLYNYDSDSDSGFLGHALIFVAISGVLWLLFRNRKRVSFHSNLFCKFPWSASSVLSFNVIFHFLGDCHGSGRKEASSFEIFKTPTPLIK